MAYSSSKAAIINHTNYIAMRVAEFGMRTSKLSFGGVFNKRTMDFLNINKALTKLNRMESEEEYQGATIFLISEASSYMTGSNVIIDGGWTAW